MFQSGFWSMVVRTMASPSICLSLSGLAVSVAPSAFAAFSSGSDEKPEQAAQTAGREIDIEESRAYVFVGKTGLGHEHGVEGKLKSGQIDLEASQNAGELVFDMNSFDADTNAARRYVGLAGTTDTSTRQQVNANMKGDPILGVRRYPTATYQIDSSKKLDKKSPKGNPMYELTGKFTLRGVSRPLTIQTELVEADGKTRLRGNFSMLQTNFGITPFKKALGAVGVTNQLKVYGDLVLKSKTNDSQRTTTSNRRSPR